MPNLEINNNIKEKIKDYQNLIKKSEKKQEKSVEKKEFEDKSFEEKQEDSLELIEQETDGGGQEGIVGSSNISQQKNDRKKKIENILASDLKDNYLKMTSERQREFKRVGEETAVKINNLFDKTKVKVKIIINLIKNWLSLIPGINMYFIEQEAKIKSDEIMKIKKVDDES
jgi:hypothetical protein